MLYKIFPNGLPRNIIRPLFLFANDKKLMQKLAFVTSYDEDEVIFIEDDQPAYQIV